VVEKMSFIKERNGKIDVANRIFETRIFCLIRNAHEKGVVRNERK